MDYSIDRIDARCCCMISDASPAARKASPFWAQPKPKPEPQSSARHRQRAQSTLLRLSTHTRTSRMPTPLYHWSRLTPQVQIPLNNGLLRSLTWRARRPRPPRSHPPRQTSLPLLCYRPRCKHVVLRMLISNKPCAAVLTCAQLMYRAKKVSAIQLA